MTDNRFWNRLGGEKMQFILIEQLFATLYVLFVVFQLFLWKLINKRPWMSSHREPKWGQWFFSKVIHDLWVLQIQHTWVAIFVIVFCKKREVNYVTFSFWRQDRETEHFWIKVFRFVILILHIEILTFQ